MISAAQRSTPRTNANCKMKNANCKMAHATRDKPPAGSEIIGLVGRRRGLRRRGGQSGCAAGARVDHQEHGRRLPPDRPQGPVAEHAPPRRGQQLLGPRARSVLPVAAAIECSKAVLVGATRRLGRIVGRKLRRGRRWPAAAAARSRRPTSPGAAPARASHPTRPSRVSRRSVSTAVTLPVSQSPCGENRVAAGLDEHSAAGLGPRLVVAQQGRQLPAAIGGSHAAAAAVRVDFGKKAPSLMPCRAAPAVSRAKDLRHALGVVAGVVMAVAQGGDFGQPRPGRLVSHGHRRDGNPRRRDPLGQAGEVGHAGDAVGQRRSCAGAGIRPAQGQESLFDGRIHVRGPFGLEPLDLEIICGLSVTGPIGTTHQLPYSNSSTPNWSSGPSIRTACRAASLAMAIRGPSIEPEQSITRAKASP